MDNSTDIPPCGNCLLGSVIYLSFEESFVRTIPLFVFLFDMQTVLIACNGNAEEAVMSHSDDVKATNEELTEGFILLFVSTFSSCRIHASRFSLFPNVWRYCAMHFTSSPNSLFLIFTVILMEKAFIRFSPKMFALQNQ